METAIYDVMSPEALWETFLTLHVESWARIHTSPQSCEHVAVSTPIGKPGPVPRCKAGRSPPPPLTLSQVLDVYLPRTLGRPDIQDRHSGLILFMGELRVV